MFLRDTVTRGSGGRHTKHSATVLLHVGTPPIGAGLVTAVSPKEHQRGFSSRARVGHICQGVG